jgi:hypothetical protein
MATYPSMGHAFPRTYSASGEGVWLVAGGFIFYAVQISQRGRLEWQFGGW